MLSKFYYTIILGLSLASLVLGTPARAAGDPQCFCASDWSAVSPDEIKSENFNDASVWGAKCVPITGAPAATDNECKIKLGQDVLGYKRVKCSVVPNQTSCDDAIKQWREKKTATQKGQTGYIGAKASPRGVQKFIPACLFEERLSPDCKNINIFVELLINIARFLFTIVGAVALAAFIYGGFVLILSQGSSEKVKKGTDAMVAALIGLIIVFSAYMLVRFLGKAIQIQPTYELVE